MPTSRSRMTVSVRACILLTALILGLAACKSGKSGLPESTNSLGITMVAIPTGSFQMGGVPDPNHMGLWSSALPVHTVTLQAFQIGKTEVTVGHYKKFLATIGRDGLKKLQDTDFLKYNSSGDDAPVVQLYWSEVKDFIKWLNSVDGGGYRLPTEAEWEYACRAGGNHTYCGGDGIDSLGWHGDNSGGKTHRVKQKKPNAFGLYDMSGNAREWVEDCWHSNYNDAPIDGSVWITGDDRCKFQVVRGGDYLTAAGGSRAAIREYKSPDFHHSEIGFRLARTR